MRNGALNLMMGVMFIVLNVAKPAYATPLVVGDSVGLNSDVSWFCGDGCGGHSSGHEPWESIFTLTNDARVFQVNLCVRCATAIQTNISNITQINSFMGSLVELAEPIGSHSAVEGHLTSFQTNLARVVQFNLCLDCISADQFNLANIEQGIGLNLASPENLINSPVPEPSTLLLLSSGILGLGLWRGLAFLRSQ